MLPFALNPLLLKDGYKVDHRRQYTPGTRLVYSNMTPRSTRIPGATHVVAFGFQYFVMEYLVRQFNEQFFGVDKDTILAAYKRRIQHYTGDLPSYDHIAALHEHGHLPLLMKAVPEGTRVPLRVPVATIRNTVDHAFWLTNALETLFSNVTWLPMTSATTAFAYRRVFERFAAETGAPKAFVPWQGHDFSFRGLPGIEAAMLSGAAHLLSFTGTDTIPAIDFLEQYYHADCEAELIGGSVPATEHSVMCMGSETGERATVKRLICETYPADVISIVADTWDFWEFLCGLLPSLKPEIMARAGKVVVRPDSGDPVKIICGDPNGETRAQRMGAIATLYETFGGTTNAAGYVELDPHVGLIYGDSITPARQLEILAGLKAKGFASSNVVLGIGSYTYQYVTRDTYGFAIKATYGETTDGGCHAIFKKPKTDDGTKFSAKGLLSVHRERGATPREDELVLLENCDWRQEQQGLLQPIFENGVATNRETLAAIRARIEAQL